MSERENGQLTLAKRTVRNGIALEHEGKDRTLLYRQKSAVGASIYLLDDFSGTLGLQSRSSRCDTVVRFTRAAR
jgi:hypothetical protein